MRDPTAEVIAGLREVGTKPSDGEIAVRYETFGAPGENFGPFRAEAARANPLVSCLMVTRGDVELMGWSVDCYAHQTWANRELVVVTEPDAAARVGALLKERGVPRCSVTAVAAGLPLGDLRNIAVARASGDIVIQWDDDDLYDPLRIGLAIAVLSKTRAAGAVMARWLLWWPERQMAAISPRRHWEGTMSVWRAHAPVYPAIGKKEDTVALDHLTDTRLMAVYDSPLQYVYAIHGRNTWDAGHFEALFADAERVFEGEAYHALNRILDARMPVLAYEAYLKSR